jgi:hypothetical protein
VVCRRLTRDCKLKSAGRILWRNRPLSSQLAADISNRADIEGAVDSVSAPQLPPITKSHPPIYSMIQHPKALLRNHDLLHILSSSDISPQLRRTLLDLFRFSQAMEYAFSRSGVFLHPKAFDEDIISIQHELLSIPEIAESEIATACRLGALICIKTLTRKTVFSIKLKTTSPKAAELPHENR